MPAETLKAWTSINPKGLKSQVWNRDVWIVEMKMSEETLFCAFIVTQEFETQKCLLSKAFNQLIEKWK